MTQPQNGSAQEASSELESLRRAFAFAEETPDPEECPVPDAIWAAVHDELSSEAVHDIIDHTVKCASCAEEWRLARELGKGASATREAASEGQVLQRAHRFRRLAGPLAALAAAVLIVVVALPRMAPDPAPPSEFRAGEVEEIRSLIPADQVLTRENCVLRWSEVEGARYSVLVSGEDLAVVARGEDLAEPRFRIPSESLARLASGAELYWQVEARTLDGSQRTSRTFVHRLE